MSDVKEIIREVSTRRDKAIKERVSNEKGYMDRKNREECMVAETVQTQGWQLIVEHAEEMIVELLEPVNTEELGSNTSLELIGAIDIARSESIKNMRKLIAWAQSTSSAKVYQKSEEEKEKETSQPETEGVSE